MSRLRLLGLSFLLTTAVLFTPGFVRAESAEVTLGKPEPLPAGIHGFNNDLVAATAFEGITFGGIEIENGVRDLRPQALRFPGGTTANNYLWRKDSFSEQPKDLTGWAGEQLRLFRKIGRSYDLPGYVRLCRQFKLTPVWVLNIYEESPESVTALLDHLDTLGLDLRAIELANEPYWDPQTLNDVARYIQLCKPLAEAIRKRKPDAKIGACFAPLIHEPFDYIEKWNAVLARESWYDAIVFHDYYGGQGFALEKGEKLPVEALLHPDQFIDESIAALTKLLPGKPIWFTEWNIGMEGVKQWKNKGAEVLFVGTAFCGMMRHREVVELSMFHQLYEKVFGAFYLSDKTHTIRHNATYELFKVIGTALANADQMRTADFSSDDLLGFATQGKDGVRLFAINRSAKAVDLALPTECIGALRRVTLECPPESDLADVSFVKEHDVAGKTLALPAHSISLVAIADALKPPASPALAGNLFPARPHLTLWYPPYASVQPRVGPDGSYEVDLSKLKDKEMVVLKMDLSGLPLKPGASCALMFEARSETGSAMTINLPEPIGPATPPKNRSEWMQLGETARPVRAVFRLDPAINNGEVSFFFDKEQIEKGGRYFFQSFKIVTLE